MATIEALFRPATVRLLEISYECDLTREGGDFIPLGVLVDLSVMGTYGLGLVARKALSSTEAAKIGPLVRADFAVPFTYLHSIFEAVFHSDEPLTEFAGLPDRHTHSLRFQPLPESSIKVPPAIIKASPDALRLWAKDVLTSRGNDAYWRMFSEQMPDDVDKHGEEETRQLRAAA